MAKEILKDLSEMFHLSSHAAQVFLVLMAHGALEKKELKSLLDLKEIDFKQALAQLVRQHLIYEITTGRGTVLYEARSLEQMEEEQQRNSTTLQYLETNVLPYLEQEKQVQAMNVEGMEAVRGIYIKVLEEAIRSGKPILAFEDNDDNERVGNAFITNYIKNRIENKVETRVICLGKPSDVEYRNMYEGEFTRVKFLPDFHLNTNVNIVGDCIMTFSTLPPKGTFRRNADEAKAFSVIFDYLWNHNS